MLRKRPRRAILFIIVAVAVGLAGLQVARHGLERANAASNDPLACSFAPAQREPPAAASGAKLRLDYAGAEALIDALERDSLSDADVDSLFRIPGLCAMVDNVARFVPGMGSSKFRTEIREFVRDKKGGEYDGSFQLSVVWNARSKVRTLIAAIRANEGKIAEETLSQLERYRPDTGALEIAAYFVAGGVSDGFAFENDPGSFYANLARSDGDLNGVVLNMAHEAYHVMQFRAQSGAGIIPLSMATDTTPPVARLFATTLSEGTANYVADPTRSPATGPSMDSARVRYRRNAEAGRMAGNFARFDDVLRRLQGGRMTWEKAYREGFTGENDASFYFVGYEMTRALEQYCGRACVGRLFHEPAIEFFRRYVALYHQHAELPGRFSRETEALLATDGARLTR